MSAISKLGKVEINNNELSIEIPNAENNSINNFNNNFINLLKEVAANPIVTNPDMYLFLLDAYEQQKDEANFMKALADAKLKYADNKAIANRELNYYIKSGKQDELVKKLEDVVSKDPNNAELLFTLGITYENLSKNGKDKLGKPMVDPVLVDKAVASYIKAIRANGNQADYQYNLGALYYNNAVEINKQMNAIAGSSAKEMKEFVILKKERDEVFNRALPYLSKAAEILSSKDPSSQSIDDISTLQSAYQAQVQIYNALGNKAKAEEYKKKISEIR
jgi:TPR repeat protein